MVTRKKFRPELFNVIDIKLRNIGDDVVFIKEALIVINKIWRLDCGLACLASGGGFEPTGVYDFYIDPTTEEKKVYKIKISQPVQKDNVDRFLLKVPKYITEKKELNDIFFVELELNLVYNKENETVKIGNFLVDIIVCKECLNEMCSLYFLDFDVLRYDYNNPEANFSINEIEEDSLSSYLEKIISEYRENYNLIQELNGSEAIKSEWISKLPMLHFPIHPDSIIIIENKIQPNKQR